MPKCFLSLLLLVPILTVAGCGGGGGGGTVVIDPQVQALADCTGIGLRDVAAIVDALVELLDAVDDPLNPPPGVTYDDQTGAFTVDVDYDDDGTPDGTITGTAVGADLQDGLDVGEFVAVDWTLATGPVTGNGLWTFTVNSTTELAVDGVAPLVDRTSCTVELPQITLFLTILGPGNITVRGTVDFLGRVGTDELVGTMLFDDTDIVQVNGFFGTIPVAFTINLDTFVVTF